MSVGKALLAALGLFTVVPVRPLTTIDRDTARGAVAILPWVGLGLGLLASSVALLVRALDGSPLLGAALAVAVLAGLTGGLHLDGLADTADGLGSRRPPEEALLIMRRSDIGPMGVMTLTLTLVIQVAAVAAIDEWPVLLGGVALAAMTGRVTTVLASCGAPGARTSGFGSLVTGVTSPRMAALSVVGVLGLAIVVGWPGGTVGVVGLMAGVIGALLSTTVWRGHLVRRLGGLTGDTYGALIEVGTTVVLVGAALG